MKMEENKEERLDNGDDYAVKRNDGTWRKLFVYALIIIITAADIDFSRILLSF